MLYVELTPVDAAGQCISWGLDALTILSWWNIGSTVVVDLKVRKSVRPINQGDDKTFEVI